MIFRFMTLNFGWLSSCIPRIVYPQAPQDPLNPIHVGGGWRDADERHIQMEALQGWRFDDRQEWLCIDETNSFECLTTVCFTHICIWCLSVQWYLMVFEVALGSWSSSNSQFRLLNCQVWLRECFAAAYPAYRLVWFWKIFNMVTHLQRDFRTWHFLASIRKGRKKSLFGEGDFRL